MFPPGFGFRQTGYGILAPTDGFLPPVTGDQFEMGFRFQHEHMRGELTGYYTLLKDFQQPTPGSYGGMTSMDLDQSGTVDADERIYVTESADGYVYGVEAELVLYLDVLSPELSGWSWRNSFMWNYGSVEFDGETEPLRHTHPMRLISALRWERETETKALWAEFSAEFVDRYDRISEGRLSGDVGYLKDPQDASSGLLRSYGLPGYTVFDLRAGVSMENGWSIAAGIENLGDKKYRVAHSRMDAPGRNFYLSLEHTF